MRQLLIAGAGGFARETAAAVYAINERVPTWHLLGFLDENPALHGQKRSGLPILGGLEAVAAYPEAAVVMCVGNPRNFTGRRRVVERLALPPDRYATIIHPTAPVAPALFALAELRPVSGRELLLAFALGVEIECRIGNAISPEHYGRGWHITSTCGCFGAAAGTGKMLSLDAERMVWALGGAATQTSGLVECLGTPTKSLSVGNAARNGLWSALLAEKGYAGHLSYEAPNPALWERSPFDVAREGVEAMRALIAKARPVSA